MSKKPSTREFNKIVAEVATGLLAFVAEKVKKRKWKLAYLDTRCPSDGAERLEFFRIQFERKRTVVRPPAKLSFRLGDAVDMRDADVFPQKWYGFILRIFPDGTWKTEFNYDPKCMSDSKFLTGE